MLTVLHIVMKHQTHIPISTTWFGNNQQVIKQEEVSIMRLKPLLLREQQKPEHEQQSAMQESHT